MVQYLTEVGTSFRPFLVVWLALYLLARLYLAWEDHRR